MQIIDKVTYKIPANIRNILLIQLGDIGDVVWTTPAIWAVKNSVPDSRVSVLVKSGFGGLLEADPSVEQVLEVAQNRGNLWSQAAGQLSFLKDIRAQHFDLVVDLRLGDRGAFMALATGAPIRVGMHHPESVPFWRKYLFTHEVVPRRNLDLRGATDQSLRILRGLGIDSDDIIPRLWISDVVRNKVREIMISEKIDRFPKWISINPFSRWSYKEWSDKKWVEVIQWLWDAFSIPAIIIGSADERPRAEALIRQCETRAFNFAGKTTLAELAGFLSLSLLHIGVDSAAPHIAAATGTPTVTIYGPSSWKDWAPPGKEHRLVLPDMDCVPCHHKGCQNSGQSLCLDNLPADQVKRVIQEVMDINQPRIS